jgi:hypothetical protein
MVESTSKIYSTPSFSDARRPSQRTTCAQAGTEALRRRASSPSTKAARQPPSDTLQNRNNRADEGPIVAFGWASGSGRVARTLNASGPNQVVVLSTTACPRPPRSHVLGQNSPVTPQPRQSDNAARVVWCTAPAQRASPPHALNWRSSPRWRSNRPPCSLPRRDWPTMSAFAVASAVAVADAHAARHREP